MRMSAGPGIGNIAIIFVYPQELRVDYAPAVSMPFALAWSQNGFTNVLGYISVQAKRMIDPGSRTYRYGNQVHWAFERAWGERVG